MINQYAGGRTCIGLKIDLKLQWNQYDIDLALLCALHESNGNICTDAVRLLILHAL